MKGRFAAAMLGLLLVSAGVSCTTIRTRVWMNEGNKLYKAQRYDEAVEVYKKIVAVDPNNWNANWQIAMSYIFSYHAGSTHAKDIAYADKAAAALEKLMTIQAPSKDMEEKVRQYYVSLLRSADRIDKVVTYYEGLLKTDAQNVGLMGQVAEIYAKKGDFDNAMKYYQKRTQVDPKNKEYWYTIGVVCWDRVHNFRSSMSEEESLKTVDIGVNALEKAIALDKEYFDAFVYINLIYREKGLVLSSAGQQVASGEAYAKADEYQKIAQDLGKKRIAAAAAKKGA